MLQKNVLQSKDVQKCFNFQKQHYHENIFLDGEGIVVDASLGYLKGNIYINNYSKHKVLNISQLQF